MGDPEGTSRPPVPGARRLSRGEVEPAALEIIGRHANTIMGTARRYSASPEDAEDAYQRALEILLTKAPSTSEDDLVPWLKTVVKHEAFALRRNRERAALIGDDVLERVPSCVGPAHEEAERYERLALGAEALGRLKPQEVRCLLLRAEGYSYKQICELTGFTYTKVNRCLSEGRRSFFSRVASIESGAECERMAPLLSALADGETTPRDMTVLRPHLRSCLTCRARLKDYRSMPARVAALVPPAALVGPACDGGPLTRGWESVAAWVQERGAELALRLQGASEVASAQKVVAVAASTAALAGGGVATVRSLDDTKPKSASRAELAQVRNHARPRGSERARPRKALPPVALPDVEPALEAPAPRQSPQPGRPKRKQPHGTRGPSERKAPASPSPASEFEPSPVAYQPAPAPALTRASAQPPPSRSPAPTASPPPSESSSGGPSGEFAP